MDLLSCSSGGISVEENIKLFKSSTVVVDGSKDNVDTPWGYRIRTWLSAWISWNVLDKSDIRHRDKEVTNATTVDLQSLRHDSRRRTYPI
jgi:hypothetical protein